MSTQPGPSSGAAGNRVITLEELQKHNTKTSAWICLKGSVYDVTEYSNVHPGGYKNISQGFGKEAWKLFNQAHSYVNYEQVLAGKKIGTLRSNT